MKGLLIDAYDAAVKVVDIEDELEEYYKILHCDTIDIVVRRIGKEGRCFDIVCDDEGVLKPIQIPTAFDENDKPCLVGSLLICNHKGEDLASLTDDDIAYLNRCVTGVLYDNPRGSGIDLGVALRPVMYA